MESAADEEHSEAVVVWVAEAAGDAAVEFDEAVDGLCAAVAGAACVEVAEELAAPLFQGAAEAGDFGDRAGGERVEDADRDLSSLGVAGLVIDRAELLGAAVGDLDLDVALVGGERRVESGALPVGEMFLTGPQDVADPVERVGLAAAVAVDLLLQSAAALVDGGGSEFDDVEGVMPTSA